jgi:hypothetical protein
MALPADEDVVDVAVVTAVPAAVIAEAGAADEG